MARFSERKNFSFELIIYVVINKYIIYIFYMVLGVGLISALIISKKNPKYLTRLQKL